MHYIEVYACMHIAQIRYIHSAIRCNQLWIDKKKTNKQNKMNRVLKQSLCECMKKTHTHTFAREIHSIYTIQYIEISFQRIYQSTV